MNEEQNNTEYVDFDIDDFSDKSFRPDMPRELDVPDLRKYLVTFYREDSRKDTWCGSGVIVGEYLITVAHVMMERINNEEIVDLPYLFVRYGDNYYRLDSLSILYDGRVGLYDDTDNIHHDLIVFKVDGISSPLTLNTSPIELPFEVCSLTYNPIKNSFGPNHFSILDLIGKHFDNAKNQFFPWVNCLLVTGDFINGDSGTPIFREKIIFGLLIGDITDFRGNRKYNFINAQYISQIISNIERRDS